MADDILEKLFEHNNWANQRLIEACCSLSGDLLDAEPSTASFGSIRQTMTHLVTAQVWYLKLLTRPVEERKRTEIDLDFGELAETASASGEGLFELVRDSESLLAIDRVETTDGYWVEPWVVLIQAINHADEHREQVCSQLSTLGIKPPALDGWAFGHAAGALVKT